MIGEKFVVDLDKQECSCRKWTITSIPCCYAIIATRFLNLNAEDYFPHWFLKSTYEETYLSMIYPVNGPHMWEMTSYADVLPPAKRLLLGRPKKKRRLELWELRKDDTQVRQGETRKRCVICRALGHKRNTCPQAPPLEQQPTPIVTQEETTTVEQTQANQLTQATNISGGQQSHITASEPVVPAATNQPTQNPSCQQTQVPQPTQNSACQQTQVPQPTQNSSCQQTQVPQPTTTTTFREKLSFRRGPITKP